MADDLDPSVVSSVVNANFKVLAETAQTGLAQAGALAAQDAVSHQRSMNMIRESYLMEGLGQRAGLDTAEAVATKKVAEADLSRTVSELGSAIAAIQQLLKGAQTTPPITSPGPVTGG